MRVVDRVAKVTGFRGRNPPASLKPLGLPAADPGADPGFRGRNPPASLKPPCGRLSMKTGSACFRGRNPPASLKLDHSIPLRLLPLPAFPGEKSPGLIEATVALLAPWSSE